MADAKVIAIILTNFPHHTNMLYLIFILAVIFLPRWEWVKASGLKPSSIRILLMIQLCSGLLIGWYTQHFHISKDYWSLHREGLLEYELLKKDPFEFIKSIAFSPYADPYGHFFNAVGSFWNDLRNNMMAKMLALFNVISYGNYYTNSLFFNCIAFIGHTAFYRLFIQLYPDKKNLLIFSCFLLPSLFFFASGIHKDMLVFASLGIFCLTLYQATHEPFSKRRLLILLISWSILLLMRNFLAMILLPLGSIYMIVEKRKINSWLSFTMGGLLVWSAFFISEKIGFASHPAAIITQRQIDFSQLAVTSANIPVTPLKGTTQSLIINLPEAINHGLLRPYLFESNNWVTQLMSIEWWLYIIIILLGLIFSFKNWKNTRPIILFVLSLSATMLIVSGWIVPNLNAIIRYRSLYLPLLITPFLAQISFRSKRIKI